MAAASGVVALLGPSPGAAQQNPMESYVREALRSHGRTMLELGLFICTTALSFYMFTTYMTTYLKVLTGHDAHTTLLSNVVALLFAAALCPVRRAS